MKRQFGRKGFLSAVSALALLLLTGTFAHAQHFYTLDWPQIFNNSATPTDTQDDWVANSYTVTSSGMNIVSISIPIYDSFTNQTMTGLIYQGFDVADPTAGGGLLLKAQKDVTFTSPGIVTITFDTPVAFNSGDIFYAAVLMRAVPANKYPFYNDTSYVRSPIRSFFDTGLTFGGTYDINQLPDNSANITPLGGTHPVVGPGVQDPGTLALWVNAQ
jgi:hypothetical protein